MFVGFVLGIIVPITRLLDAGSPERTLDLVQAHGQVQLLGFAGLFVMGMSLRLMPRFAGSRLVYEPLALITLALFVGSLGLRAVVMPWFSGDAHTALLLAAAFALLIGSSCFLFITTGTLAVDARRFEASSLAFLLGAMMLFAASAVGVFAALRAIEGGSRSLPYLVNNAVLQLQLAGFLLSFILGVALRAIPTMVGVERAGASAGRLAVALAGSVVALASSLLYLEYASYSSVMVFVADASLIALGFVLLVLAWQAGIYRQAANRIRPASQANLWLIRSAFVWMVAAAFAAVYFGGSSLIAGNLPDQFDFDALRHALGVGVITMLIMGMSLMILPEFAAERRNTNRQRLLAFVLVALLNAATLTRVVPSLVGTRWTQDERNFCMAIAGSLAEIALLVFAAYFLRLSLDDLRHERNR